MLYPMAAMVLLTFIVGFIAVKVRFSSVKTGQVKAKYYSLMEGQDVPKIVIQTTRNFNNQFETPLLFYIACTLYLTLNIESVLASVFAWSFVGLRYVHAYIHITYNHLLHRMLAFWAALLCILVLWVNLVIQYSI